MNASLEANAFARHLEGLDLRVPHLTQVLHFEEAVTATLSDGQTRIVEFEFEPLRLLRALAEGRLPDEPPQPGRFEIELTPDGPTAAVGLDVEDVQTAFPVGFVNSVMVICRGILLIHGRPNSPAGGVGEGRCG